MRKILVLLAAAGLGAALAQSASAADLSPPIYKDLPLPPPAFSWTGFYVGLNGGGGWGQTSHTASFGPVGTLPLTTGYFDADGGLAGGTLGYNYQMGHWVLGAETDLDWSDIKATQSTSVALGGAVGQFSLSSELMWLDTTRVRLGWAYDRVLFYGTAGAAVGGLQTNANASASLLGAGRAGVFGTSGDTQTRFGWTAGAGIEYAFLNNLSAKVEYLYVDLGSQNQLLVDTVKFNTNMVRAGLNLRF
jgi:outer membrane immunogenic protein